MLHPRGHRQSDTTEQVNRNAVTPPSPVLAACPKVLDSASVFIHFKYFIIFFFDPGTVLT